MRSKPFLVLNNLPLFVEVGKKGKKWYLNLNRYRNTHHMVLAQAKVEYTKIVRRILKESVDYRIVDLKPPLHFEYTLFPKTRGRVDVANPLCIVDKFVSDALVRGEDDDEDEDEVGLILDDDSSTIAQVTFNIGPVDKNNPRARLMVYPKED